MKRTSLLTLLVALALCCAAITEQNITPRKADADESRSRTADATTVDALVTNHEPLFLRDRNKGPQSCRSCDGSNAMGDGNARLNTGSARVFETFNAEWINLREQ
ncbi:hypothetical protein [Pseudomonas sp. NPDC086278]|uniref:hypothetical protein n=1 Tax=Pseudomonas sp. NPDC086278 TaxID=3390646 RepID=UPI003D070978